MKNKMLTVVGVLCFAGILTFDASADDRRDLGQAGVAHQQLQATYDGAPGARVTPARVAASPMPTMAVAFDPNFDLEPLPFPERVSGKSALSCYTNARGQKVCKRTIDITEEGEFVFNETRRTHQEECTWVDGHLVSCSQTTLVQKADTKKEKSSSMFFSGLGLLGAIAGGIGGGFGVHYINGLIGITGGWGVVLIVLGVLGGIAAGGGLVDWIGSKFD